jgi:hypothetical protein
MYGAIYYGGSCYADTSDEPPIVAQALIAISSRPGPRFVGEEWKLDIAITDEETGQLVDPTILIATVERPDHTLHAMALTRRAAGKYSAIIPLPMAQVWRIEVNTGGTYMGTGVADVVVLDPMP